MNNETVLKQIRNGDKKKSSQILLIKKDQDFPRFSEWIKFGKSVLGFNGVKVNWNLISTIKIYKGRDPGRVEYLNSKGKILYFFESQSFLNGG